VNEDKAARYHRLRRRASLIDAATSATLLLVVLGMGWSAALRDWALAVTASSPILATTLFVAVLTLALEAVRLPMAFHAGIRIERWYDLSTESTSRWWADRFKGILLGLPMVVVAGVVVWLLMRWSPDRWWLLAAVCLSLTMVLLAYVAPVVLVPLFTRCEPLERPALVDRLTALATRAGTRVLGVFEWRVRDRTRKANAVLAGMGRTRRILLSDTLLAGYSDDEIEVILAHELAHHVHRDIWTALALDAVLMLLACYVADAAAGAAVGHVGLQSKSDIAGLPLLVLCGGVVSRAGAPLVHAVSRAHERRADRYALTMTRNATAFASAIRRLASQNLAEEQPSRLVEWLCYSHPPTATRLAAAREWETGMVAGRGAREGVANAG
jgi:STE24 endopeptidase